MVDDTFSRNELIWGCDNQKLLSEKHVAVIGLGGVGGYAVEALARAGIGEFTIVDFDIVSKSNINRQLIALNSTIGQKKTGLFTQRLKDINPLVKINDIDSFYTEDLNNIIFSKKIDYVIDAIDTVKSKIQLLEYCYNHKIPVITSLGAGNRLDPTKLCIKNIKDVQKNKCNFVTNIIKTLDKKNIRGGIDVIISEEIPKSKNNIKNIECIKTNNGEKIEFTKVSPGSVIFVPAVAGYYLAYQVINSILCQN